MTSRKKLFGGAGLLLASAMLFAPAAWAQTVPVISDPAHHSTDVNDPDPAHHRPILLCPTSAGGGACVLTPVAGFDLNGYPLGTTPPSDEQPPYPSWYNPDPAHHSTDLNDPDPAHHRPVLVWTGSEWELQPIPGFDLNGHRV